MNDSLKAQAGGGGESNDSSGVYKLVNVSGGGELVRMMKSAIQTKNFTQLDYYIQHEVVKYLYNGGQGEKVNKIPDLFQIKKISIS